MSIYSGDVALSYGDKYLKTDINTARLWYNMALEDSNVRTKAILRLMRLERKTGNYSLAREYANSLEDFSDLTTSYYIGRLEQEEFNLLSAIENYSKALASDYLQLGALMFLADVYTQLGEFDTSRKMFETLIYNPIYKNNAIFGLVNLDIIEQDYKHGLKTLKNIGINKQNNAAYEALYITLMYLEGKINEIKDKKFEGNYTLNRLLSDDKKLLINHIDKHIGDNLIYNTNFYPNVITENLFQEIESRIKSLVPKIYRGSLIYQFNLEYDVGFSLDKAIKGICIVKSSDGKKILTMYPVDLSSEFDREGLTTSEALKRKRELGVRK